MAASIGTFAHLGYAGHAASAANPAVPGTTTVNAALRAGLRFSVCAARARPAVEHANPAEGRESLAAKTIRDLIHSVRAAISAPLARAPLAAASASAAARVRGIATSATQGSTPTCGSAAAALETATASSAEARGSRAARLPPALPRDVRRESASAAGAQGHLRGCARPLSPPGAHIEHMHAD